MRRSHLEILIPLLIRLHESKRLSEFVSNRDELDRLDSYHQVAKLVKNELEIKLLKIRKTDEVNDNVICVSTKFCGRNRESSTSIRTGRKSSSFNRKSRKSLVLKSNGLPSSSSSSLRFCEKKISVKRSLNVENCDR